MIVKFITIFCW